VFIFNGSSNYLLGETQVGVIIPPLIEKECALLNQQRETKTDTLVVVGFVVVCSFFGFFPSFLVRHRR
jgi:hypothetical protein